MNPSDPVKAQPAPNAAGKHSEKPANVVFTSMSGMGADEHDTQPPGAAAQSVEAGHEPDRFNVKPILYIPMLVVVTVLVAFGVITTLFYTIVGAAKPDGTTDPQALALASQPINDRFARISSSDPDAAFKQPRLEYMKQAANSPSDPAHYRSKLPTPKVPGSTYEIYPQDLRPENFIDPTSHRKTLVETAYVNKELGIASIPIADAMTLLIAGKKLPLRKANDVADVDTVVHTTISTDRAKLSNSGRGGPSMRPAVKPVAKPAAKVAGH